MREREREGGAWGRQWRQGHAGPGWTGLGWVAGAGQKPTTHVTTDRKPPVNRNPKRDETNTRLNTTSDKRNMLQHDATPMST
jgi:hypothetical protein